MDLLGQVIATMRANRTWLKADAIVLPGGFLRLRRPIGHLPAPERALSIAVDPTIKAAQALLATLQETSPGCLLITGVLADPSDARQRVEQVCVALSASKVVGMARKIFPTRGESRGRKCTTPNVEDYRSRERLVTLPSGHKVLLSACYDLFGLSETTDDPSMRYHAIRRLRSGSQILGMGEPGFRNLRRQCLQNWADMLKAEAPPVAIATIHGFERPGLDGFWQRHGIAAASASLNGGLAVGAAHFEDWLPEPGQSTLASNGVPKRHLTAGTGRKAHRLAPKDSFSIEQKGEQLALVRLFEAVPAINQPVKRRKR
ncbi:hypothetical protein [Ferrovibrio sp.]|uniref:hypothetical protein n=1 Tax=Ferrovibrio sp. TaxID=1917215 RepID=UPI0035B3A174